MCQACSAAFDPSRADAFAGRLVEMLESSALAMMLSIGHRTGLLDAIVDHPGSTSADLAERTGLNECYIREWLGSVVTGGIVEVDPDSGGHSMPAEHAALLTRAAGADNIAPTLQFVSVLGAVEDDVVDAFTHGRGVPYASYARFHPVMAEESANSVVARLESHIIPLVPGLAERLAQGIDVLDVGCGRGAAMLALAERYPSSRFTGVDLSEETIAHAAAEAQRRGLVNVDFVAGDASRLADALAEAQAERDAVPAAYDWITTFDAIHDQPRPDLALAAIRGLLREGGVYLMQEIAGSSHVHENVGRPLAPFIYAISTMHCMSVSLAQGGMGLGAAWGRELASRMLEEAGFDDVRIRTSDHDIMNEYYVMQA